MLTRDRAIRVLVITLATLTTHLYSYATTQRSAKFRQAAFQVTLLGCNDPSSFLRGSTIIAGKHPRSSLEENLSQYCYFIFVYKPGILGSLAIFPELTTLTSIYGGEPMTRSLPTQHTHAAGWPQNREPNQGSF